jgi:hypothetical protein
MVDRRIGCDFQSPFLNVARQDVIAKWVRRDGVSVSLRILRVRLFSTITGGERSIAKERIRRDPMRQGGDDELIEQSMACAFSG